MLKAIGLETKALKRRKIGNLSLGKLKPKEYKYLTKKEIKRI